MSFSFGFSGDDIEDDGGETQIAETLSREMSKHNISNINLEKSHVIEPKRHALEDLLSSLPSQISYNTLTIPTPTPTPTSSSTLPTPLSNFQDTASTTTIQSNHTQVLRRSLFDIRAQLMAEADPSTNDDAAETMLAGLESGDLTSGIYEGGFKTWECALDLACLVATRHYLDMMSNITQDWEVIELGAGSAVPSLALLRTFLGSTNTQKPDQQSPQSTNAQAPRLKFTLCDYNEEVLRLCTAPNVLLNYHYYGIGSKQSVPDGPPSPPALASEEGELDMEEMGATFLPDLVQDIKSRNVSFDFISGGWGDSFLDLIPVSKPDADRPTNLLILASETIYSPASSKIFADTLLRLLRRHDRGSAKAWVAAKKVYFGVGGGVDEFVRDIENQGGRSRVLLETKDTGVGRVVLEITT
ncbi:hypothetical protein A1O1_05099 [Capronia coronata CBS 617.96]|uniref:protein-histidine N-methyltransferase n=1 Tax=Capronia coronata CBS 617.96 TaxID=1182541 RepID=W9YFY6_9EURO|nr:uncharacterized protein A1O1_05099 [Capronia coronata CBS 617.96]EXJ88171.1 hypothetical protein A1O1_05099 [Capronia coronata CBS 617.96]